MKKSSIDWNDHIQDFIKIKLQKPSILSELVRRQSQFSHRRKIQIKIQGLRSHYEQLTQQFRNELNHSQKIAQAKKQLQKEIVQLNGNIIRLEVEVEKLIHQSILPQITKQEPTRSSINSDSSSIKKQEELSSILTDHAFTRQSISTEIADLIARRIQLTEEFQSSASILQQQINKKQSQEQFRKAEQSLANLQYKLQKQKQKRKKIINKISDADLRVSQLRKSRQSFHIYNEQINKRLHQFVKQCKKVLMSDENRNGKKYKQLLSKYQTYTQEEEDEIKQQYFHSNRAKKGLHLSYTPFPIQPKTQKYEDMVIQIMKKFSTKSISQQECQELDHKVSMIGTQYAELAQKDRSLSAEIIQLKQNLDRKNKQVEMMKSFPEFNRKSN